MTSTVLTCLPPMGTIHPWRPRMAQVQVRDTSIWINHIHGDPTTIRSLAKLKEGQRVTAWVSGIKGVFEKMKDGPTGPTQGLKPCDEATRDYWKTIYPALRGQLVEFSLEPPLVPLAAPQDNLSTASDAERNAAWAAFKALQSAGWRSEGKRGDRDELHER